MKLPRFSHLVLLSSVVVFAACTSGKSALKAKVNPELPELMAQGAAAERDGMKVAALARYEEAAQIYPTSKAPWLKIARIQFDSSHYGEAIVAAQQVVARDDSDEVARSILSVSGLRIATKAVADLSKNRSLTGSVRTEAQELASVLRESLGENVLVPSANNAVSPLKSRATNIPPAPAASAANNANRGAVGSSCAAGGGSAATSAGSGSPFSSLR